jgi:hypothetical protein
MLQSLARRRRNYLRYHRLQDAEARPDHRVHLHRQKSHVNHRRCFARVVDPSLVKQRVRKQVVAVNGTEIEKVFVKILNIHVCKKVELPEKQDKAH